MLRLFVLISLAVLLPTLALGQDVPDGVTYKRAADSVNAEAKATLEKLVAEPGKAPMAFAGTTIVVGPMLWREMEPSADESMRDAEPLVVIIPAQKPITAQGRRMLTDARRAAFWAALWRLHPELKGAAVRKARAAELWYYWATIPFDIQEPFFTLDTGRQQFIVNIITAEDNGTILWIDVVGDLAVLAARPN